MAQRSSKGHLTLAITASRVGDYYHNHCDRFSAYHLLRHPEQVGWDKRSHRDTALKQSGKLWEDEVLHLLRERGEFIACKPAEEHSEGTSDYDDFTAEETIALLREARDGYLYQTTIDTPESFAEELLYGTGDGREYLRDIYTEKNARIAAHWNISKPDLIRISHSEDGTPVYSVIDIKHARRANLGHKVQVAIYARLLESLLRDKGIPGRVDLQRGYVWNFKKEEPMSFDMEIVMPYVERYFHQILPKLFRRLAKCREAQLAGEDEIYDRSFHAEPGLQCELCENYEHCIAWQEQNEPVTLLPYLTASAQRYLREHNVPLTADGFEAYISDEKKRAQLQDNCVSLRRFLRTGEQSLKALRVKLAKKEKSKAAVVSLDPSSMMMPAGQDVSLFLTAQQDVVTDRSYLFGIRAHMRRPGVDLFGTGVRIVKTSEQEIFYANDFEAVFLAETPDQTESVLREFMECLYGLLNRCSSYNRERGGWEEQLSLQAYVMDHYERINLEDVLLDALLESEPAEEYREKLLTVFFWMQEVRVITDAVRRLFSIPAYISYGLDTISEAFLESRDRRRFERMDAYMPRLSNVVTSDMIHKIWMDGTAAGGDGLRKHIEIRLSRESDIVKQIQFLLKNQLKHYPEHFSMETPQSSRDPRGARLRLETLYEELLTYHDTVSVRMNDLDLMAEEGQIMKLSVVEETHIQKTIFMPRPQQVDGFRCRYRLENAERYLDEEMFFGLLLPVGDPEAEQELLRLTKPQEGETLPYGTISHLYTVDDIYIEADESGSYVCFTRIGSEAFPQGREFYIVKGYKDLNSAALMKALAESGNYLYPERYYHEIEAEMEPTPFVDDYGPRDGKRFTKSQANAFEQLFHKNITLLLGPPGTGKTDFIARAVITLYRYYREKGKNFSVLLTANSHAAINNILSAIAGKSRGLADAPVLYKLGKWDSRGDSALEGVSLCKPFTERGEVAVNTQEVFRLPGFVLGATCWQALKAAKTYNEKKVRYTGVPFWGFDLIVIDEASQVRAVDALLDLECAMEKRDSARYLIVGDEDQLPPIIQGRYEAKDQEVYIYGSIFRLFYDTARVMEKNTAGVSYIRQLEEQFRMNEILSRYPAQEIYDKEIRPGDGRRGYHAYDFLTGEDRDIARRQLPLAESIEGEENELAGSLDALVRELIAPDYPMVVCRLSGGEPVEKQQAELRIVTALTKKLRGQLIDRETGAPYPAGEDGDKAFWGYGAEDGGLGIISPHHEQIGRLREAIATETGMRRDILYIGTVDKLQGQQREAVIVSYGVTDPERAAQELQFIYSRNRLNVAMTRGKSKMVCILSDILTDRPLEAHDIEDEEILRGIDYMTRLTDFMQTTEEDTECRVSSYTVGGVTVEVYRKRCV